MLHLIVISGLCNRLFAIISAMRYALKTQQPLTIYWKIPVARYGLAYTVNDIKTDKDTDLTEYYNEKEHLIYFFKEMPNVFLKSWTSSVIDDLLENNNQLTLLWDGSLIIPEFMKKDINGKLIYSKTFFNMINIPLKFDLKQNVIINMPTSPFGYDGDNQSDITRDYLIESGKSRKKTSYELELSHIARKLIPIDSIQQMIHFYQSQFTILNIHDLPKMGIHIRRTDLITLIDENKLDTIIDSYIQTNLNKYVFFLSSDDILIQRKYENKYKPICKLLTYSDINKTYNNLQGAQKAIVDLYMLASCNYILGTNGSSFSYYSFILSNDDTLFEVF